MNKGSVNVQAVISYITWVGWLIAMFTRNPSDRFAAFHLNQALVLNICATLAGILRIVPLLGALAYNIVSIVVFVLWCIGLYRAVIGSDEPIPIIGQFRLF